MKLEMAEIALALYDKNWLKAIEIVLRHNNFSYSPQHFEISIWENIPDPHPSIRLTFYNGAVFGWDVSGFYSSMAYSIIYNDNSHMIGRAVIQAGIGMQS